MLLIPLLFVSTTHNLGDRPSTHHILVRLFQLLQSKYFLVHHRLDPVCVNCLIHLLKLLPATDQGASDNACRLQHLQEARLVLAVSGQEANDRDHSVDLDSVERLFDGFGPSDFDDVVDAQATRTKLLGGLAPVLIGLVVDDVVGAELLESFGFCVAAGSCDDTSTGRFSKLVSVSTKFTFGNKTPARGQNLNLPAARKY